MTFQILISIHSLNGAAYEAQAVREIIEIEIADCAVCQRTLEKTGLVPYHCHSCFSLRDERWLRLLLGRIRASALATRH